MWCEFLVIDKIKPLQNAILDEMVINRVSLDGREREITSSHLYATPYQAHQNWLNYSSWADASKRVYDMVALFIIFGCGPCHLYIKHIMIE